MMQRGRKSSAALAVVDEQIQAGLARIPAPAGLTQAERDVWLVTVNSKPADWYGFQHVPIMVEYVRHVCRGHVIDQQLKAFTDEWLATDEGLARFEKLTGIATKNAGMVNRLATAMRLTQQSVIRADKVGNTKQPGKVWQREPVEN